MTHNKIHERIELQAHKSGRGNLYVGTAGKEIPFEIKRFYVIRDVPAGETRGTHAHKRTDQAVFCLQGSFDLLTDDGTKRETTRVDTIGKGVLLRKRVWHSLGNFSADCIVLVLSSEPYDEADYIQNYKKFLQYIKQ